LQQSGKTQLAQGVYIFGRAAIAQTMRDVAPT